MMIPFPYSDFRQVMCGNRAAVSGSRVAVTAYGGALKLDTYRVCHSEVSTLITHVISSSIFLNTMITIITIARYHDSSFSNTPLSEISSSKAGRWCTQTLNAT
jgi:hypothetical protein